MLYDQNIEEEFEYSKIKIWILFYNSFLSSSIVSSSTYRWVQHRQIQSPIKIYEQQKHKIGIWHQMDKIWTQGKCISNQTLGSMILNLELKDKHFLHVIQDTNGYIYNIRIPNYHMKLLQEWYEDKRTPMNTHI